MEMEFWWVAINRCVAANGQLGFWGMRMRFLYNSNCPGGHLMVIVMADGDGDAGD